MKFNLVYERSCVLVFDLFFNFCSLRNWAKEGDGDKGCFIGDRSIININITCVIKALVSLSITLLSCTL